MLKPLQCYTRPSCNATDSQGVTAVNSMAECNSNREGDHLDQAQATQSSAISKPNRTKKNHKKMGKNASAGGLRLQRPKTARRPR